METLYLIFIDPFVQMVVEPSFLAEVLIGGLMAGVMYSLVALGFVLIFKASGIFNFAQGIFVLFAALNFVGLMDLGVHPILAFFITIGIMTALAFVVDRLVLRPLVNQDPIILFMATIGIAFFLEGFGETLWGGDVRPVRVGIPDEALFWDPGFGEILVQSADLFAGVIAAFLVTVLALFFHFTPVGRALRAARRRPPGGALGRHSAQQYLGDRLGGSRVRGAGCRHYVGGEARRAIRAFHHRTQGAAGPDPRRVSPRSRAPSSAG